MRSIYYLTRRFLPPFLTFLAQMSLHKTVGILVGFAGLSMTRAPIVTDQWFSGMSGLFTYRCQVSAPSSLSKTKIYVSGGNASKRLSSLKTSSSYFWKISRSSQTWRDLLLLPLEVSFQSDLPRFPSQEAFWSDDERPQLTRVNMKQQWITSKFLMLVVQGFHVII